MERHFRNGINPLWANDNRILEELHFIHQVGFEQALRNVGATFDEKAIDAPEAKLLQGIGEIHPTVGRLPAIDNSNPGTDPAFAGGENAQVSVSHTTVSTTNGAAVRDALARGDKIGAIKLLREQTGVGLKEAKEVIDALESGQSLNIATKQVSVVSDSEIEQLIRDDKMIYAIKAYREKTGASLKEAKDAVDAIKAAMEH